MSPATTSTVKKTTRTRKSAVSSEGVAAVSVPSLIKNLKVYEESFVDLLSAINASKEEFIALQKGISDTKDLWIKEQHDHEREVLERNQQEEIAKKREAETYDYEIALLRKKAEDEFLEKKTRWERELADRKEEIAKEKQELEILRKQVAGFEAEKEKAVREACSLLSKQLQDAFVAEKKLREQEVRSQAELLALKIANLTGENTRQSNEINILKKSLEDATYQLKEVAVKVIESAGNKTPTVPAES